MADSAFDTAVTFKRQKHSIVWNHFERMVKRSIHKHCGKSFTYYEGTSNLNIHFKNPIQVCGLQPIVEMKKTKLQLGLRQ